MNYHFDIAKKSGGFHEKLRDNVHLLNNTVVNKNGVDLIFSTMWTQISPAKQWTIEREMNDFHVIAYNGHKFTVSIYNQLHRESLRFLQQALINKADKSVVISHHLPTFMNYPEKILNDIETAPIPEEEKIKLEKIKVIIMMKPFLNTLL